VTVICGHITTSMLWGNTAYCVKLSGEDLSRYSLYIIRERSTSALWMWYSRLILMVYGYARFTVYSVYYFV